MSAGEVPRGVHTLRRRHVRQHSRLAPAARRRFEAADGDATEGGDCPVVVVVVAAAAGDSAVGLGDMAMALEPCVREGRGGEERMVVRPQSMPSYLSMGSK